ncbi:hypothetical protein GCM10020219_070020 [Nonomuraea dietziae]
MPGEPTALRAGLAAEAVRVSTESSLLRARAEGCADALLDAGASPMEFRVESVQPGPLRVHGVGAVRAQGPQDAPKSDRAAAGGMIRSLMTPSGSSPSTPATRRRCRVAGNRR